MPPRSTEGRFLCWCHFCFLWLVARLKSEGTLLAEAERFAEALLPRSNIKLMCQMCSFIFPCGILWVHVWLFIGMWTMMMYDIIIHKSLIKSYINHDDLWLGMIIYHLENSHRPWPSPIASCFHSSSKAYLPDFPSHLLEAMIYDHSLSHGS